MIICRLNYRARRSLLVGRKLTNSSLLYMKHKIDKLSELPEPIVEHILSFISLKKILQLSTLSKEMAEGLDFISYSAI